MTIEDVKISVGNAYFKETRDKFLASPSPPLGKTVSSTGNFGELFYLGERGLNVLSDSLAEGFTWKDGLRGRKKL